jgi:hypothetical protein
MFRETLSRKLSFKRARISLRRHDAMQHARASPQKTAQSKTAGLTPGGS